MARYLLPLPSWDAALPAKPWGNQWAVFAATVSEVEDSDIITPVFRATIQNPGIAGVVDGSSRYYSLVDDDVEIARGKMLSIPSTMGGAKIELEFHCKPPGADDILEAAADALRVGEVDYDPDAPMAERDVAEAYDPLFLPRDPSDDPASALSGRPEVWRWDRKSLAITRTHVTDGSVLHDIGRNGLATGSASDGPSLRLTQPPKAVTKSRLVAGWTQEAKGRQTVAFSESVTTFSYEDFIAAFPKAGDPIGSNTGWSFGLASIEGVADGPTSTFLLNGDRWGWAKNGHVICRPKVVSYTWCGHYDYRQQRSEYLDISLRAGVQDVLFDDESKETVEQVSLAALNIDNTTVEWTYEDPDTLERMHYVVGDQVLANDKAWACLIEHDATEDFMPKDSATRETLWERRDKNAPMRDSRSPKFFDTPRGIRALRHGIRRLHRIVLKRARCAEISFEVPWELGRDITCDHACRVEHRHLPGGEATGKVTSVTLQIAGARKTVAVTIGCTVGDGVAPPAAGVGQESTAGIVYTRTAPGAREPVDAYALAAKSPRVNTIVNNWAVQEAAGNSAALAGQDPLVALGTAPTQLRISYDALAEQDVITRRLSAATLPIYVPKGINLTPET
ncbi:hypothetical protein E0H39_29605 [Rhizobium leguminosarum bv. viciae]|uniref:hypothetical protein n=1 Tax=Rhizobium leguminosarum TaxID=384 RepID=UPI00103D62BD|nr:hypothetical protein [Rhizobium leguminosarum]TBY57974.1 hypothetical protein E0H39_29605 [Rhizobium leguminosarum bv. viciae]